MNDSPVILFDGVCNLCNGAVTFIIRRDPTERFMFAPLQSEAGQRLLLEARIPSDSNDTILLIEQGQAYTQSTAALRIAKRLHRPWPLLYMFIIVPRPLRNHIYKWIARHRYTWFGRTDSCMLPTPELKRRFIDQ